jgi:hypothetical protein
LASPNFDFFAIFSHCGAVALLRKMVYTEIAHSSAKREVFSMLTLRGIITILVLAGLFALAVVWISKQGGWKGEGCGGNCASCHQHCDTPEKKKN